MKNINVLNVLAVASVSLVAGSALGAVNLVNNGDFETIGTDFTSWTQVGNINSTGILGVNLDGSPGHYAYFGAADTPGGIQQDVAVTLGQTYTLEFDLENGPTDYDKYPNAQNSASVTLGTKTLFKLVNASDFALTHYVVPNVVADGKTLELLFQQDAAYYKLDNVSLTAVPEPSTIIAGALLLLPFGASAIRGMRKKQNV